MRIRRHFTLLMPNFIGRVTLTEDSDTVGNENTQKKGKTIKKIASIWWMD
jgi:hypothetical protein